MRASLTLYPSGGIDFPTYERHFETEHHILTTATIKIEGMRCDGCAERVRRVLEREPGVAKADVSYSANEARVEYDGARVTPERLAQVIERAGYTAWQAAS